MQIDTILEPNFFRIENKIQETKDTFTVELISLNDDEIAFLPGQFNMLYAFGVGEVPVSISGNLKSKKGYVHTIKTVGNVTKALSRLEVGEKIGVRGPFGSSWPIDACIGRDVLVVAGGIGLAPMRPLIYELIQKRSQFARVNIIYGARDPNNILFENELMEWKNHFEDNVFTTVDFAGEGWNGSVGAVTNVIPCIHNKFNNCIALLCGPEIMFRFVIRELLQRDVELNNIYLAMERNMKCAIGHCGRCQYVSNFTCKDGSILPYSKINNFFTIKEI